MVELPSVQLRCPRRTHFQPFAGLQLGGSEAAHAAGAIRARGQEQEGHRSRFVICASAACLFVRLSIGEPPDSLHCLFQHLRPDAPRRVEKVFAPSNARSLLHVSHLEHRQRLSITALQGKGRLCWSLAEHREVWRSTGQLVTWRESDSSVCISVWIAR